MDFDEVLARIEAIRHSPEQRVVQAIEWAQWSVEVFRGNCAELRRILTPLEEELRTIKYFDIHHRSERDVIYREIGRLVHNFLASAMALVNHTRRHMKQLYEGCTFLREYHEQIRQRFSRRDSWHPVVQALRNYTQHRTLPGIGSILSYKVEEGTRRYFYVPVRSLLTWDGWDTAARKRLEPFTESHLPIRQLVDEYETEVASFYEWLWNRQSEIHREDLRRLNRMKDQTSRDLDTAGYGDMVNPPSYV